VGSAIMGCKNLECLVARIKHHFHGVQASRQIEVTAPLGKLHRKAYAIHSRQKNA